MLKYEYVVDDMRERIRNGKYRPNEQLPTIEQLCKIYDVSETTIKKAIAELSVLGLIATRKGSGTYVKSSAQGFLAARPSEMSSQMAGFLSESRRCGFTVETDVKLFEVIHPSEEIARKLAMSPEGFCYHAIRVRSADSVIQGSENTMMPIDVIPGITMSVLHDSIYEYIEGPLGLKIDSANRIVRAVMPSAQERAWYHIGTDVPALEVEQIGFLDDGTAFEYSIAHHVTGYEFRTVSIH